MKRSATSEPEIITKRFKPVFSTVGTVQFWDVATQHAKISGDGNLIAAMNPHDCKLFLVSLNDETPNRAVEVEAEDCVFGFSGDGKSLVTVEDRTVRRWDLHTDTPGDAFKLDDSGWMHSVVVNRDASVAAVWSHDFVWVVNLKKPSLLRKIKCDPRGVSITPNGKFVIIKLPRKLLVLQPESEEAPKEIVADSGAAWDNERVILVCNRKIHSLNLHTMETTVLIEDEMSRVFDLTVGENGTIMTCERGTDDVTFVDFWDANLGVHLQSEVSSIHSLLSADGKTMCRIFEQDDIHILRRA